MERDDLTLLHEPDLMLAALRVGVARPATVDDCIDHLRLLRRSAQIDDPLPEAEVRAGLETALAKLRQARLIEALAPGRFRITARGRKVLADNPDGVDDTVLMELAGSRPANGHAYPGSSGGASATTERRSPVDYQRGYEANLAGASLADNPHAPDVRAYLDWENGWSQARDDRLTERPPAQPERRQPGKAGARRGNDRATGRSR